MVKSYKELGKKKKKPSTYRPANRRMTADLSSEARRQWSKSFKVLKETYVKSEFHIQLKYLSKIEGGGSEIRVFQTKSQG